MLAGTFAPGKRIRHSRC